ncbi:Gfo/Idh/MocA family oxidoreductase [Butyricicoccus faecihominis]|uniref:Gfo/Idh/MocA family protein n=1 Tax=Butyricicoccus faecihominis TaxID=1712515 RepID=UPI0024789693|nr:Gfo/Idh/MocA family oxidoreductase [Butyricicoccus faecihominis]MCQ5130587.1 Gfo/Idh/MocA family oxidoreductase [Butyricicoccus faecihominis]
MKGGTSMLHYGIVGGGTIAFVHYRTARFDGLAELCAGCFSRNDEKNRTQADTWHVPDDRTYSSFEEMAERELARPDPIDFVVIATPNSSHFEIARTFLSLGIHVFCEKPLTNSVEEARSLCRLVHETNTLLCVNYSYSGYPMIHQARKMIEHGEIGHILKVVSEYKQDGQIIRAQNFKPWHFNPAIAGPSACAANIGTHIEYLVSTMTGLHIQRLSALFDRYPDNRVLETDFSALVQYENGSTGTMWGCKTAIGEDCNILVRIYGSKGSLEWSHLHPQLLKFAPLDQPVQILTAGRDYLYPAVQQMTRLSNGQIEGYHDATANLYREFIRHICDRNQKREICDADYKYPRVEDGLYGVIFVHAAVASNQQNSKWVSLNQF